MTTNQEWLFSLTLEEYLEWMESEHHEPKNDVSGYGADFNVAEPNFDNIKAVEMDASRFEAVEMDASRLVAREPDSREKLEADVRKHYAYSTTTLMYPPSANKTTDMLRALPVDTVIGWLDRQAAITREEADAGCNKCFTERHKRERELGETIDGLTEQMDELTAERDKLKEEIMKYGHDCTLLFDEKHKLTAERDEWKTKCETREIAYKQADAERKRYSEQIDELTAERDNLQELNEYHAHQYELASEDIDRMHAQVDELNATIGKLQKQVNELVMR